MYAAGGSGSRRVRRIIMSKRCPDCGSVNKDSRIYCTSCGRPLDPEFRLLWGLSARTKPAPAGDKGCRFSRMVREKKPGPLPGILLAAGIAVVIIVIVVLSR